MKKSYKNASLTYIDGDDCLDGGISSVGPTDREKEFNDNVAKYMLLSRETLVELLALRDMEDAKKERRRNNSIEIYSTPSHGISIPCYSDNCAAPAPQNIVYTTSTSKDINTI